MRLIFDENGFPRTNQVQLRQFSCACVGCKVGEACIEDWPENVWKLVPLHLRRDAVMNVEEAVEEDIDDNLVLDNDA